MMDLILWPCMLELCEGNFLPAHVSLLKSCDLFSKIYLWALCIRTQLQGELYIYISFLYEYALLNLIYIAAFLFYARLRIAV